VKFHPNYGEESNEVLAQLPSFVLPYYTHRIFFSDAKEILLDKVTKHFVFPKIFFFLAQDFFWHKIFFLQ